jgi:xylose isomerase
MDCCARGLKAAAAMIEERPLIDFVDNRYSGWNGALAAEVTAEGASLSDIRAMVTDRDINPKPVSGRQEHLENVVNRYV